MRQISHHQSIIFTLIFTWLFNGPLCQAANRNNATNTTDIVSTLYKNNSTNTTDSSSGQSESSADSPTDLKTFFTFADFSDPEDYNKEFTDNDPAVEYHKVVGKFVILPEEDTNIFNDDTEDLEHRIEDPHFRSKVSYASDGTKIIQHDSGEKPTPPPTPAPETPPPPAPIPFRKPKANTTTTKWMKDGTRIIQFNTGIEEKEGTNQPSWKFIKDEYVEGYSDDNDTIDTGANAAGYKFRERPGEKTKIDLKNEKDLNETGSGSTSASNSTNNVDKSDNKAIAKTSDVGNKQAKLTLISLRPLTSIKDIKYKPVKSFSKVGYRRANMTSPLLERSSTSKKIRQKHPLYDKVSSKSTMNSSREHHFYKYRSYRNNKTMNATSVNIVLPKKHAEEKKNDKAASTNASQQEDLSTKLLSALRSLQFKNEPGIVKKGQDFAYISQCGLYTEPQNVSTVEHAWATKTYVPYFYLYEKPKHYEQCKPSPWLNGTDMRGNVFISFEVKSIHGSNLENNAKICQKYCCKEPRCAAWVLRKQSDATANCPKDSFCCWLKTAVPKPERHEDCISGVVHREHYRHPPTGMRSAVPLGGLGAGSFEIRADGTFHEWTIGNQSPGGSAKLSKTSLDLAFFGIRLQQRKRTEANVLRTHAPHGFDGMEKIGYYGSWPVSKFDIEMKDFKDIRMSMYAYSTFHPRNAKASATPAVAFSLDISNPTNEDLKVSYMFNLPFGYQDDTIRRGGNFAEVAFTRLVTAADCQRACAKQPKCMAWTTNGPFSCMLKDNMPLHAYEFGIISGLKGMWEVENGMLTCTRPGFYAQSGQISLYPLFTGAENISFGTTDDAEKLWKQFTQNDTIGNGTVNITALHGAVKMTTTVPAGETKVLSMIMAWYFPNRDLSDERVGNYYTHFFKTSEDVALQMKDDLLNTVLDIIRFQFSVIPPKSIYPKKPKKPRKTTCEPLVDGVNTLPECLQDILMNSLSFWRSGAWMENGRWRQWEAFDCANMDPVHVDFHRIIPYILFFPELSKNVMRAWADHQLESGMIQESLSMGCLEETLRDGTAGGRAMADVNVAFVVQAYLIYSWTNDTEFFDDIYPAAKRALLWLITDSTHGTGLPYRKPDTYDLFELDKYDHCAYNSILYKLALRAGQEMGRIQQDLELLAAASAAYDRATILMEIELWDEKSMFYKAWFDVEWGSPEWLMADTFYGQVWAYTLGLGDLVDRKKMESHLLKENLRNDSPYGLKVISKSETPSAGPEDTSLILGEETSGCKSLENITKFESIWMSASTDWSALQLHLGVTPRIALHQAEKSLDHYRSTLKDQWNFHGLTSSEHYGVDGLPWATSHYTFHLVLWHIPLALSGQLYYAPTANLTFNPTFEAPYWLPFYTPQAFGNIETKLMGHGKKKENLYTVTVTSGTLNLKHLSISGHKFGNGKITINEGQSVSWSAPPKKKVKQKVEFALEQLKMRKR